MKTIDAKRRISSRLKPYGRIRVEVRTRFGVIKKSASFRMDSLVANYWQGIYQQLEGDSTPQITNLAGNSLNRNNAIQAANGAAGSIRGIAIGTGTTAFGINDFDLDTRIAEGSGAGQMLGGDNFIGLSGDTGFTVQRSFENASGSSIDVNETGLVIGDPSVTTTTTNGWLLSRDVFSTTFTVDDGEAISITYDIFIDNGNMNFHNQWVSYIGDDSTADFTRLNGTTVNQNVHFILVGTDAEAGDDDMGILLGTGDTALSFEDEDLDSRILQGTGAGQIQYGDNLVGSISVDTDNDEIAFNISRSVMNNSGGDITIREIGLAIRAGAGQPGALIDRFILSAPITLGDGEGRTARYLFRYSA